MIIDLTRGAVKTKLVCTNFSPLISQAEVCYACYLARERFGLPGGSWQACQTIEELLEQGLPEIKKLDQTDMGDEEKRLILLLERTKVTGVITEEIRPLLDG